MTITLDLTPELEAKLVAESEEKGIPLIELVKQHLSTATSPRDPSERAREIDAAFERIADLLPPEIPPIPDEALRRENMYAREDDWNG